MKALLCHKCFNWLAALRKVAVAVALICLIATATSCRSVNEIVKEVPVHDTTYITKTERDSVYFENIVKEYVKGDTVYSENTVTKYVERTKTDTLYNYIEKPVEVEKIVEVEKKLTWFQKTLMWMGVGFVLVVIGFGISFYVKLKG